MAGVFWRILIGGAVLGVLLQFLYPDCMPDQSMPIWIGIGTAALAAAESLARLLIRLQEGNLALSRLACSLTGYGIAAAALWLLLPPPPITPKESAKFSACLSNLKLTYRALAAYSADNDYRLPPSANWMDAIEASFGDNRLPHCPSVESGGFGYALNRSLAGSKLTSDVELPLAFESEQTTRNATAYLPLTRPRHRKGVAIVYSDGHAKPLLFGVRDESLASALAR